MTYINGTTGQKIDRIAASTLWDLWEPTEYDTTDALAALDAIESEAIDTHRQANPPAPAVVVDAFEASSSTGTTPPNASGKRPAAAAITATIVRNKASRTK